MYIIVVQQNLLPQPRRDHVAIMKKSWNLVPKILSGEKIIESRWHKTKSSPWNKINPKDTVYFKTSGEPVTVVTTVTDVLEFEDLTPLRIREIVLEYGARLGLGTNRKTLRAFARHMNNKKYCILVFLKNPKQVKPFGIDKAGFGAMASWIVTEDISKIKK